MHLSELVFKKKAIFYFLLICVVIGGIISYQSISKLEDPEITIMQARVVTIYPGASAHEVELQVTDVLENELSALADLNEIRSKSEANVSMISVELKMTVPQKEIQQRWEFLRRKVEAVKAKLPEGTQTMVIDDFGDVYGMFYAMTADGYSYQEMEDYAKMIKKEMTEVDGVKRIEIYGEQTPVVNVVIPVEKLSEMGIFPIQIMSAIAGQNKMVYPGSLESGNESLMVHVNDKFSNIEDLKNLIIQGIGGQQFKLEDIATIEKGYSSPLRNTLFINNHKALGISLSMESGENIITLGERVDKRMNELKKELPAGFEFQKVFFQPDKVKASIHGFMFNLLESVAIVILVLMLTMGLQSGVIIGIGLILTVLATFPILLTTGGTLQRISLGAFIIAMGMLVDNAIVVADGIIVDLQRGVKRKKALVNSAKQTAMPLLGATLIAVSAFLPVFLSKDTAGTYARDLFVVLCISLLLSWILAITQIPLFSERFLKIKKKKQNKDPFDGHIYRLLRRLLSFLMNHKLSTVILTTILLLLAVYNFKNIKKSFFPDFNYNQVYIEYTLPDGTSPDKVNADLHDITNHLMKLNEVKMVISSQGMSPTRYCLVRAIGEAADNYGELIVNFEDYPTMVRMKPILNKFLHENYPDAYIRIRKYNLSVKSSHAVEVEFTGPDPAVLHRLSDQAQEIMRNNPYTDKYTICDDWEPMGKSIVAQYNQTMARRTGTSRSDVSNAILAATGGLPVAKYYEGQTGYTINVQTRNNDGTKIQTLDDIPVWNMLPNINALDQASLVDVFYGTKSKDEIVKQLVSPVPLSAVTNGVKMKWEESVVHHSDGKRAIQAQCDVADEFSPALTRSSMLDQMNAIEIPEGYEMRWVGEYDLQKHALKNIFSFLPISVMLIILILIILFNDIRKPAIVLLCIPLAAIGIVPGMIITGSPFTFMAIVGSLGLMGMLIKNSIVLLDEIEIQIRDGVARYTAVINATISRTRPVLMASITTILGMLPLLSDPMYSSMAVAIISGLLVGTIITLVFIPILYALMFKVKKSEVQNLELSPSVKVNDQH